MKSPYTVIGFDGDDTLWHDLKSFIVTEKRFSEIVRRHVDIDDIAARLVQTERKNLEIFGFGVKGYTLSLLETAIETTNFQIPASDLQEIINLGITMMQSPVKTLEGVEEVLNILKRDHKLVLITKGDLFHQESKIARSGLSHHFDEIEIVSQKGADNYQRIMEKLDISGPKFLMVGNSVPSDVLPVLEAGGHAVHIPYFATWSEEQSMTKLDTCEGAWSLDSILELPNFIRTKSKAALEGTLSEKNETTSVER